MATRTNATSAWPNTTLHSSGMALTVSVPDVRDGFYRKTRFDWGSMVGLVQLALPDVSANVTLFGDAHSPAGLVAEYGCGGSGALCPSTASSSGSVSNGVLGFGDAGKGGEFLKIGVGKLRRPLTGRGGTRYETAWSYELAEPPAWTVLPFRDGSQQGISLSQRAVHKRWGWSERRTVVPCDGPQRKPGVCIDV
eukprot:5403613-Prymnesium_polylepis.1